VGAVRRDVMGEADVNVPSGAFLFLPCQKMQRKFELFIGERPCV
jgi:hypothetical protein